MIYTVSIPQITALQSAFAKAPRLVTQEVIKAGNRALIRYQGTAREGAPIDKGQLRSSIQVRPMHQTGNRIEGSVGSNLKHALLQEQGTGIYGPARRPIRPVRAKQLAWQSGGKWHFAKQIKGSRPHWFMRTSTEKNVQATVRDFDTALKKVTEQIGASR